jgi:hypothetical protein
MKTTLRLGLSLIAAFLAVSCGSDDDGGGNNGGNNGGGWQNDGGAWGTMVGIPNDLTSVPLTMRTTNEGIYMTTMDSDADLQSVYRLQIGGPSPVWNHYDFTDGVWYYFPANDNSENPDEFAIYYHNLDMNGFISMNSDVPANLEEEVPLHMNYIEPTNMAVDNSPQAYTWAFYGGLVKVNPGTGTFEEIVDLPTNGINFVEPDPDDAVMWVAAGTELFRLTVNGDYTTFDVDSFSNPDMFINSIEKIRFSGNDVYFRAQNNVFKITGGTSLSLFYEIDNGANFLGGDFAVDNNYMYATDGIRKQLSSGSESSFMPDMPSTGDQDVLMEYITNTTHFQTSQIEVSKEATGSYIYSLAHNKVLIVPKSSN